MYCSKPWHNLLSLSGMDVFNGYVHNIYKYEICILSKNKRLDVNQLKDGLYLC